MEPALCLRARLTGYLSFQVIGWVLIHGVAPRLSKGDPSLSEQLELNPKLIASTYFYVAFKRSAQGEYWVKIFNEGLKKIDVAAIMQRYIKGER